MNAPIKILRARPTASIASLLLFVSTSAGLGGCADLRRAVTLPPVNPESPVAGRVAELSTKTFPRPRLRDVPPVPKNIPSAPTVKQGVIQMVGCRHAIVSYGVTHPQLNHDSVANADRLLAVAQVNPADVPPADSAARSEDLAARLRAFAAPPGAIKSGPAPTPAQAKPLEEGGVAPPAPNAPTSEPAQASAPAVAPDASSEPTVAAQAKPQKSSSQVLTGEPPPPLPKPGADPLLERCS